MREELSYWRARSLASLAWTSIFVMLWLRILRVIEFDTVNWAILAFFFIVAVFASALSSGKRRE